MIVVGSGFVMPTTRVWQSSPRGTQVFEVAVVERLEAAVDHAVFGFHGVGSGSGDYRNARFRSDLADPPERLLDLSRIASSSAGIASWEMAKSRPPEVWGSNRMWPISSPIPAETCTLSIEVAAVSGAAAGRDPAVSVVQRAREQR